MALAAWQDSDDEFAEEEEARFSGKTALLVVIDVTPKMFESWGAVDGGGDSEEQEGSGGDKSNCPFSAAIKVSGTLNNKHTFSFYFGVWAETNNNVICYLCDQSIVLRVNVAK
jgi:hypothetical protein